MKTWHDRARFICTGIALACLAATAGWSSEAGAARAPGEDTLPEAARRGDTATALTLIGGGADINAPSVDGTTALMWAVHRDDIVLIDKLLQSHANVGAVNDYGSSAMSEAAEFGDTKTIAKLLKAGADVESPNADGQTALMILARTSNVDAARLLLDHGAKVNATEKWRGQTALHWAAAQSQPAMVKELLHHHADPNARSTVNVSLSWRQVTAEPRAQARPPGGLTPLLYAARQGCLECAKYLIEAGADPNLTDPEGVTPLLMATVNFHFDLAAYLLKKGANANQWDWWGRTPLYAAVDLNTLPYGGRPDKPSLDDTSSLKMIQLLLDAGANPNVQLKLFPPYRALGPDRGADMMLTIGTTPLLRAAKAGDAAAIRLLLAHGANPNLPNNSDISPLMAAAGLGSNDIDTRGKYKTQQQAVESIDLLAAAGADINAGDKRGQTALHGAAYWGWNDVVKCLASHEARLDAKDARGMTPIDSAMGRAGGHGRGGQSVEVHQDTADLIKQLMANTHPPSAPVAMRDGQ
jgi:ankyrin repeat protein